MTTQYDASVVGGLRVRASRLIIETAPDVPPVVHIEQTTAVTMNDHSSQQLQPFPTISQTLDLATNGDTPIPLVDFVTGAPLGGTTTLNSVMLQLLAVVRQLQLANNP